MYLVAWIMMNGDQEYVVYSDRSVAAEKYEEMSSRRKTVANVHMCQIIVSRGA